MRWRDIMWETHPFSTTNFAKLNFGVYELSIVEEINEPELYELAIISGEAFVQLPGIHPEVGEDEVWDDVLRFQTREEVIGIIRKLESITGKAPLNVYN